MVPWCSGLTCLPVTQEIAGSNPVGTAICGFIAQSVEQRTENPCVAGSIPVLATSVGALYVLLLFSLAGENNTPMELVISLNHPKQIFKNIFDDCELFRFWQKSGKYNYSIGIPLDT